MVTLQVFPEGSGPESGSAYAKFPLIVKGGSVSAKWKYKADQRELPPENNPKFIFTAELKYTFEVSGNRCKKVESNECQVKNPKVISMEWEEDFAYPGDTVKSKIKTFEMKDFSFLGILNFYDKQKFANSEPLFSENISIDTDDKEFEIELPMEKINMSYKDDAGFAKLCAEVVIKDINYSYIEKETLDILIDFGRD